MEEKNSINFDLAKMNDIFDNKTMRYRINGFARACNMNDLLISGNSKILRSNNNDYFIALNVLGNKGENSVTLSGDYKDFHFSFINYYDINKSNQLDRSIIDLPFSITIIKTVDQETYKLEINTIEKKTTEFKITKSREFKHRSLYNDFTFVAPVMDFSEILKLIKSFIFNPVYVFNTYNEIRENYRVIYTNHDFNKPIIQDERLDKPMSKIHKLIKRLSNSD